eukprot:TRINITY_DN40082_c0_g1_i1.p1 TRINITY_DN40082_c0_g1~~TRINITY_DN40082_c0_g1_i1.p1  ORF type:complete len:105 (+),score=7.63 TRINITY_DN40082_c0_g1_i1:84-398(+)
MSITRLTNLMDFILVTLEEGTTSLIMDFNLGDPFARLCSCCSKSLTALPNKAKGCQRTVAPRAKHWPLELVQTSASSSLISPYPKELCALSDLRMWAVCKLRLH